MASGRRYEWTLWVVAAATALHATDELLTGWLEWAPRTLGIRIPLSLFVVMNAVLTIVAFALARGGWRRPTAAVVIPTATLANGVLFHILPSFVEHRAAPGLVTAVSLYLPFSTWALVGARKDGVARRSIGVGAIIGMCLALGVVLGARAIS